MNDTCLDTTKSQSPDVRLLRVIGRMHDAIEHHGVIYAYEAKARISELIEIAADIRATTGRPALRASDLIDLIRVCPTKGDVMACVWDHKTALRQMEPGEAVRTLTEALIAMARQSVGGRG
jgi:hypothetical protein